MKRKKKLNRYVLNLLLTTVFGGVIGFINYLFNVFIARFTPETVFALYSTAIGLIYLIQIPAASIQNILTKGVGESKKGNISKLKNNSIVIFSVIGIVISLLFFFLIPVLTDPTQISRELILPLTITLILSFLSPISKGLLLGKEKIILVNSILFGETLLRFLIGFIGIRMGGDINVLILASAIPAFLSFLIAIPFIKSPKSYKKKIKIPYRELILMTISLLLLSAPYTLDLILTPGPLKAQYGALSLIGKIVYFSSVTVAFVMFSRLSNEKSEKEEFKTLGITVFLTFLIGIIASLFLFLFKDLIIDLAFGGRYSEVSIYFAVFGLVMSAYAVVFMFANFFFSRDSYWYIGILLFITVLQVYLFRFNTSDLFSIVRNQVIVYCLLLFLTILYFIFNFIVKRNGKKDKKAS